MKKKLLFLFNLIISISLFSSCNTNENAVINTVSMFGDSDPAGTAYMKLLEQYEEKTGHEVQDNSDSSSEVWKASIISSFGTAAEPDVLFYFTGVDAEPILDKMVDIQTIRNSYPDYADNIRPDILSSMTEKDGNIYAVPVKGFYQGVYCNKDLFSRYDVPLPTDWDKLVEGIHTFRANGIDPISISFSESPHYFIECAIMAAGGISEHFISPTADVSSVPSSWAQGLDLFKLLGDMDAFPPNAATKKRETSVSDFISKKAAMIVDGSWIATTIIEADEEDNVVVLPFPTPPGGKGSGTEITAGFGSGFYITKHCWEDSETQKAAVDFVRFMTSKEGIKELMAEGAGLPAVELEEPEKVSLVLSSGYELVAHASGTDMPIDSRLRKNAWTEILNHVNDIAQGKITGQEVLAQAIPMSSS